MDGAMEISSCKKINLPKIVDNRGNISVIEENRQIPFTIKRVYYLYDVPSGESRGGHAHRKLEQLIVSTSGSFNIIIDNGKSRKKFHLNRPNIGLYIPPMNWRELENFSAGSVCLVLASEVFDESDYIRDYDEFISQI
jgi:hypothetical protein